MRNSGFSQRPPKRGGHSQRRSNKPGQHRQHRKSNQAKNNGKPSHPWLSDNTPTLTSHISMSKKRKPEGQASKMGTRNGASKFSAKNRGKFNPANNKARQNNGFGRKSFADNVAEKPRTNNGFKAQRKPDLATTPEPVNPKGTGLKLVAGIDPFELFCAYHLGINRNNQYKQANINEVANRFAQNPATIHQALKEYHMDSGSLLDRDFDMALAQLDIQVAPEGIDRTELGRTIYEDFRKAPVLKRDWKKILEEDRKENRKVFGDF